MALSKIKSNSIEDAAITATQIATDAVDSAEIAANAVGTSEIAANAVAASELADDAVDTDAIADDAVTGAKVALFDDSLAATDTHFLIADGTDYSSFALSGDVTASNAGAVTIADNAVTLTKQADGTQGQIVYYGASGAPTALAVGTSGQVLTSGGASANLSWTTVSGTTINNNADNRVITGSGTANTLEGESDFTYDGADLIVNTSDLFVDGSRNAVGINTSTMTGGGHDQSLLCVNGTLGVGCGNGAGAGAKSAASNGMFFAGYKSSWDADSSARILCNSVGGEGSLWVVSANKPGDLVRFADVVLKGYVNSTPSTIASVVNGSVPSRTYSVASEKFKVLYNDSGGTWNMFFTAMGACEVNATAEMEMGGT